MKLSEIKDERLRRRILEAAAAQAYSDLGAVGQSQREPAAVPPLASRPSRSKKGKSSLVRFVVTFISFRTRKIDDDNLCGGMKALRDSVAGSLGIDDGDERVLWQYCQVVTHGEPGTQVIIETL